MDLRPWTVERTNVLFSHPRVVITEEAVRLPSGRLVDDYLQIKVAEHVVIIVRSETEQFLVQRQYKHGPRALVLTFPAGGIERGETPYDAARRELEEETGIRARVWRYFGRFVLNGNQGSGAAHLFLTVGIASGTATASPAHADLEEQEALWLTGQELVDAAKCGQFKIASHALALGFALNPKLWPDPNCRDESNRK
jgi:ADP-ribose pyrophosphatase